eukprot:449462-Karenia_brevis.AAC.1
MKKSLRDVCLPHMVMVPSATKWTRFGSCLDYHLCNDYYDIGTQLVAEAYNAVKYLHGQEDDLPKDD